MDGSAQDIQIRGNIFRGGRYGVNLNLPESHRSRRLLIANNTFLDTIFWVGLWATDPRQDQFEISNNLILGAHKVHWDRVDQPSQAAGAGSSARTGGNPRPRPRAWRASVGGSR